MLLLPIGQENAEIRRHPWVFWGLLGLNVLAFVLLVLPFRQEDWASRVRHRAEEVGSYLVKHPYLRLPKGLMEQVPPEALSQIAEVRQAALSEEGVPIPYVVREQQAELNRLAEAFLAAVGETPQHRWGLVPSRLRVSAFLTHMFLHAGWLHILGNLLFLYLTAPFVEDLYGRPLFLALYVGSGLLAAATHVWQHSHSALPLVGASGAIAGVMGAFLVRLGRSRIEFFLLPVVILPWIRFRFFLPAFVFLPLWLLEQLWYARHEGLAPGTAWWAHVGGFVAGAGMALAIRSLRVEERWVNPGIEAEISFVQDPALGRAADARRAGDWAVAEKEIRSVLAADPESLDARSEAYEIAVGIGDRAEAARRASQLLDLYRRKGERQLAESLVADAYARLGGALPPRFLATAATLLEEGGHVEAAVDAHLLLASSHPADPMALKSLLRVAERRAGDGRPAEAREALLRALAHPEAQGAYRLEVEKRLEALGG